MRITSQLILPGSAELLSSTMPNNFAFEFRTNLYPRKIPRNTKSMDFHEKRCGISENPYPNFINN